MGKWTVSTLGKEYIKAVYCHPAYLTYMQITSCEMLGWMKLESRLLREISITSDMQTPPLILKEMNPEYSLEGLMQKLKLRFLGEMPGWMKHKLESKLQQKISITSDTQMTPPLWLKVKRN